MTGLGILFALVNAILLWVSPRRWAPVPLLVGAAYMTAAQEVAIGPLHFTIIRLLVAVGVVRVMVKGERIAGGLQGLDRMLVLWACWGICSSVFHKEPSSALVLMLGMTYNTLGLFFLMRIFIRNSDDFLCVAKALILLLIPLAGEMILEKATGKNLFSLLGGVPEMATVRHGKVRAQGPFGHAILAGTVGAACMPLAILFWWRKRKFALLGFATTGAMIVASASSGPIMTALIVFAGLAIWRIRSQMRLIRWGIVLAIVALDLVMKDPVYYLLARIDLTGSSTGWHRAALIRAAIEHFNEWWLGGTDYTRDWMPTGVPWSPNHTDITNHYIAMGVWGGLPLMLLFIGILWMAFAAVGKVLRRSKHGPREQQFLIWTLGAILFSHAVTFLSVCYFDQTVVFLYFLLAAIGSLAAMKTAPATATRNTSQPLPKSEPDFCHSC